MWSVCYYDPESTAEKPLAIGDQNRAVSTFTNSTPATEFASKLRGQCFLIEHAEGADPWELVRSAFGASPDEEPYGAEDRERTVGRDVRECSVCGATLYGAANRCAGCGRAPK